MQAALNKPSNLNRCSDAFSRLTTSNEQSVIAPHSIGSLFALIYLGARGETRDQLAKFFGLTDDASVLSELDELTKAFDNDSAVRNFFAFYARPDFPLEAEFQGMLKKFGDVRNISFSETDRKEINALVENKTDKMIKDFISSPFDPDLVILLLNTILCKLRFRSPFYEQSTKKQSFNCLNGSKVNVDLMHQKFDDDFRYAESHLCQVMELYCNKTRCRFGVILPKDDVSIGHVQNIDPSQIPMSDNYEVDFYLPRFTIEKEWNFVDLLKAAGLVNPFSSGEANFSGVDGRGKMYISMAIQKVKIEVDEKGATAAAASALGGSAESCFIKQNVKPVTMKCNRTFCGYIRLDDKVLFRFTYDGKI